MTNMTRKIAIAPMSCDWGGAVSAAMFPMQMSSYMCSNMRSSGGYIAIVVEEDRQREFRGILVELVGKLL